MSGAAGEARRRRRPADRRFTAFGRRFEIVGDDDELTAMLDQRLPRFPSVADGKEVDVRYEVTAAGEGWSVTINRGRRSLARDRLGTANRIVSHLQLDLARHARELVFVHAGVVRVAGVGIVIPGRSFSGKSTLVRAFCAAGAAYASDEFAVVDSGGRVWPYARPLALRLPGGGVERLDPAGLAGGVVRRPCRVGLVLLPRYRSAARWRPRRLSPGLALLELMRHVVAGRERPSESLAALRRIVDVVPVLAGERGDAADVVASVSRRVLGGEVPGPRAARGGRTP